MIPLSFPIHPMHAQYQQQRGLQSNNQLLEQQHHHFASSGSSSSLASSDSDSQQHQLIALNPATITTSSSIPQPLLNPAPNTNWIPVNPLQNIPKAIPLLQQQQQQQQQHPVHYAYYQQQQQQQHLLPHHHHQQQHHHQPLSFHPSNYMAHQQQLSLQFLSETTPYNVQHSLNPLTSSPPSLIDANRTNSEANLAARSLPFFNNQITESKEYLMNNDIQKRYPISNFHSHITDHPRIRFVQPLHIYDVQSSLMSTQSNRFVKLETTEIDEHMELPKGSVDGTNVAHHPSYIINKGLESIYSSTPNTRIDKTPGDHSKQKVNSKSNLERSSKRRKRPPLDKHSDSPKEYIAPDSMHIPTRDISISSNDNEKSTSATEVSENNQREVAQSSSSSSSSNTVPVDGNSSPSYNSSSSSSNIHHRLLSNDNTHGTSTNSQMNHGTNTATIMGNLERKPQTRGSTGPSSDDLVSLGDSNASASEVGSSSEYNSNNKGYDNSSHDETKKLKRNTLPGFERNIVEPPIKTLKRKKSSRYDDNNQLEGNLLENADIELLQCMEDELVRILNDEVKVIVKDKSNTFDYKKNLSIKRPLVETDEEGNDFIMQKTLPHRHKDVSSPCIACLVRSLFQKTNTCILRRSSENSDTYKRAAMVHSMNSKKKGKSQEGGNASNRHDSNPFGQRYVFRLSYDPAIIQKARELAVNILGFSSAMQLFEPITADHQLTTNVPI